MTKQKQCAGTYHVSGYTRADGTQVDGYMRTCGAKHEGHKSALQGGVNMYVPLNEKEMNYLRRREFKNSINNFYLNKFQDALTGGKIVDAQGNLAKSVRLPSPFLDYYRLSLDYVNESEKNKDNTYTTFGQLNDLGMRAYIKEKYKDCNITDSTPVVIVQMGTPLSEELMNSEFFYNSLNSQLEKIQNGDVNARNFSLSFSSLKNDPNLVLVLGKCNVYNLKHKNYLNTITGSVVDYYDFSKLGYASTLSGAMINAINNNAKIQQDNGMLRNYILIIPFVMFESDSI